MRSTRAKRALGVLLFVAVLGGVGGWEYFASGVLHTRTPTPTATTPLTPQLPARFTATPNPHVTPWGALLASPVAPLAVFGTSPFQFPTSTPHDATPTADCTQVFPIESVEAIHFGQTTTAQLEAAFGPPASVGGRPTTYRFRAQGCALEVSVGFREAQEAVLHDYGTLGWLLARYGEPDAVGISEGNLVLLIPGRAVLLYPDRGVIAIFDVLPDELTRATPIGELRFRAPYEVEKEIARLKLAPVETWQPPHFTFPPEKAKGALNLERAF